MRKVNMLFEFDEKVFISDKNTNWEEISFHYKLSEDFIRKHKDKVNWYYVSGSQELSESFIREFQDKVFWSYISSEQKLSENFIREFQNKVDWLCIFAYQKISEDFKKEFKYKLINYSQESLSILGIRIIEEPEENDKFFDIGQINREIII
jgi:hypothetical protein